MVKWINYVSLESDWDEIENKLGMVIPDNLREIIQKFNKGMPRPNKFCVDDKVVEFDKLLSFNLDESYTVYLLLTDAMKKSKILPFGTTTNNNLICLKNGIVVLYNPPNQIEKSLGINLNDFINSLC